MKSTAEQACAARRRFAVSPSVAARERRKKALAAFLLYAFLIVTVLPIVAGYGWLLLNSFSTTLVHGVLPEQLTLKNWRFLVEPPSRFYPDLWRTTWNTLALAVGTTVTVVAVATPAAYALSRLKFPGRGAVLGLTLVLHAFPGVTLLIATYYVLRVLGLLNSIAGVFLVKAALMLPLAIWVLKGFYDNIPWDVEMSALIDGASRFQAWLRVMLPQVTPGIASVAILSFLYGWSEYIYVITFIQDKEAWTLASYINTIVGDFRSLDYGLLSATALFYIAPVLLFFLVAQKYLLKAAAGGSKGGM
ncbi:MAG: carbohydrate ABC transporter permease [Limnochordales bacterium]|jgi:ABC-type sugar transport system, permease component|nr:carbohydrate ABC transporter permease [Bacillota bacterium]